MCCRTGRKGLAKNGVDAYQFIAAVQCLYAGFVEPLPQDIQRQLATRLRARARIRNLSFTDKTIAVSHGYLERSRALAAGCAHNLHAVRPDLAQCHARKIGNYIWLQITRRIFDFIKQLLRAGGRGHTTARTLHLGDDGAAVA